MTVDESAAAEKVAALLGGGGEAPVRAAKGVPSPADLPSSQNPPDENDEGNIGEDEDRPLDRAVCTGCSYF